MGSGFLWALSGTLLYLAYQSLPGTAQTNDLLLLLFFAAVFVAGHDLMAGLLLTVWSSYCGKCREIVRNFRILPGKRACFAAILGGGVGMLGYQVGLSLAGSLYSMPITALYPLIASLLSIFYLKEKLIASTVCALFLSVTGSLLISLDGMGNTSTEYSAYFFLGICASFLAVIGWASEGLLATSSMDLIDPDIAINLREISSAVFYCVIVIPLLFLLLTEEQRFIIWHQLNVQSLSYCSLAGIAGGISYLFWYRSLHLVGVTPAMALNITYAVWAIPLGIILTGQSFTTSVLGGATLIVIGAVVCVVKFKSFFHLRKNE